MRVNNFAALFTSFWVLLMAGCGGGGGGGTNSGGVPSGGTPQPTAVTLSGVVSKGPVRNGHVQIFQIIASDSSNAHLASTPFYDGTTDASGNYSTTLPASVTSGGMMIQVLDGDYTDEATGATKNIAAEYGANGMRAVFGNISGAVKRGGPVSMHVTPYTEMAVRDMGGHLDDTSAKLSHDKIEHAFGFDNKGIDIVHTKPLDATQAAPAGSGADEVAYGVALATMSQFEKDFGGGKNLSQICDDLLANHMSSSGVLDDSTTSGINTANQTFVDNRKGGTNPGGTNNAPAAITLSGNPASGVVNGPPVVISANVATSAGVAVPDGTSVTFAVSAGTGTLSSPAAQTAGGVATVNLTSSVAGASVTVTATAGSVSQTITVPFAAAAVQPTLAIVKVGTSGTLPAGTLIGGIAANVNYAPNKGLSIAPAGVVLSGVSTGSNIAANTNNAGQVAMGLINVQGIPVGEFATLTFSIAPGFLPTAADFSIAAGSGAVDVRTVTIPGISASILSVTLQ